MPATTTTPAEKAATRHLKPMLRGIRVEIVRGSPPHRQVHRRFFEYADYPDQDQALIEAMRYRQQILSAHPVVRMRAGSAEDDDAPGRSTGIVGVTRTRVSEVGEFPRNRYAVTFMRDGKRALKNFDSRLDTQSADAEFHAFLTAREFRRHVLESSVKGTAISEKRFRGWAEKRVYKLPHFHRYSARD